MNTVFIGVGTVWLIVLFTILIPWCDRTAKRRITDWAANQGGTVRELKHTWFGGPFWLRDRNGFTYSVVIEVAKGERSQTRQAWVYWPFWTPLSLFGVGNDLKVKWIEEPMVSN